MTQYQDEVDAVAHNFNNSVLTLGGTHNVQGPEMFSAERVDDEVTWQKVASGMAIAVEDPSKLGLFKLQVLESSPTTKYLWDKRRTRKSFKISMSDASAPALDCSAKFCRIAKPPITVRSGEVQVVEWTFGTGYLEMEGDSYRLESDEDA
ncbi:hypothetical protein KAR91_53385 [Candidatus Pacearchaeota archaeon]|nr:hypothetical protein [Candidatus Pacearchaeota archaeon]